MNSTYKPMATKNIDSNRNNTPSVLEKYGHITVVTASINQLFLFLRRQLFFLSSRDVERFGDMVGWASANIEELENMKNDIRDTLDEIAFDFPTSFAARFLKCKVQKNDDGRPFSYCKWYHETNPASDKIKEENTLALGEARVNHLLDQLCFRINNLIYRLDRDGNCEYDFSVKNLFNRTLTDSSNMLESYLVHQKTLEKMQEKFRSDKKTNGKNFKSKTATAKKPSTNAVPVVKEPVEPRGPTPNVSLESLTNNF